MDGILIVNKEKGYTSHDVVGKLRKILKIKQIGHAGTLDPNATGVLPILIGKATKTSKYLMEHDKTYIATIKLGIKTNTGDGEGSIIETKEVIQEILKKEKIEEVLKKLLGKQKQIPPMYSSIKVNGKKLYEYARIGQEVEIEARDIEIYEIKLKKINKEEKEIIFTVNCSKGTYIRSLCEDIAEKLNTVGYMSELQRVKVDKFELKDAITLQEVETKIETIEKKVIPIEAIFKDKEQIMLSKREIELFLNGVQLTKIVEDNIYRIYDLEGNFIGIGKVEKKLLKRDIIL